MLKLILTVMLMLGLNQLASAQWEWPDPPTSNCAMPCETDQDCAEYDTDITTCLTCMPQGLCGNPTCFDTCATSNSCPPECPICSFQQCVAPESDFLCTAAPETGG